MHNFMETALQQNFDWPSVIQSVGPLTAFFVWWFLKGFPDMQKSQEDARKELKEQALQHKEEMKEIVEQYRTLTGKLLDVLGDNTTAINGFSQVVHQFIDLQALMEEVREIRTETNREKR